MENKNLKTTLTAFALLLLLPTIGFNQARIQFDTINYNLVAGEATSICLSVTNGNFTQDGYEIEIAFDGSSLPHFPGQGYRKIHLNTNQYCFSLQPENLFLLESLNSYKIGINSLDTGLFVSNQLGEANIRVWNHLRSTKLGPKDLIFIGYDNEISSTGNDKIVLFNVPPIGKNTTFSIANLIPADSTENHYKVQNDTLFSAYQIEYTSSTPIPPLSKISFQIERVAGTTAIESIEDFTINGFPTSNFTVTYTGTALNGNINLNTSLSSSLILFSGSIHKLSNNYFALQGNLIDGISFAPTANQTSLNEINSIVNLNIHGSSFGFLKCNGDKYLCDFLSTTSLSQSWYISNGTVSTNLIDTTILDTCDLNLCLELLPTIVPSSESDSMDIVLLIDNSRSITAYYFDSMKVAILGLIEGISLVYPNTRFAVVQYCNTNEFDITVPFTYNTPNPIDFDREYVGDSYMGAAVNHLMDELDSGNLQIRDNVQFHTIIFTDASASHIIDLGFEPFNSLKSSPFYSTTSMVRYNYWESDYPVAASTTSIGGDYYGPLEFNPGDPDGTLLPRRYYNLTAFQDPLDDVLADITQSNYLEAVIDTACENPAYEWITVNGGEIVSNNGAFIETNAQGTYIVNINCNPSCIYSDTFNYSTALPLLGRPQNHKLYDSNEVSDVFKENEYANEDGIFYRLNIYPTLSEDLFNIEWNSNTPGLPSLYLYDINGKFLFTTVLDQSQIHSYYYQLNLINYSSGIYIVKVFQNGLQKTARILKINK